MLKVKIFEQIAIKSHNVKVVCFLNFFVSHVCYYKGKNIL